MTYHRSSSSWPASGWWRAFFRSATLFTLLAVSALLILAQGAPPPPAVLAEAIQPFIDNTTIAGAVMLVASKDKVLDLEVAGYADIAAKKLMEPGTFFWIASMSKAMTATCMMMLVDEGKVSLDDPVEKYVPEFKDQVVIDRNDHTHTPHPAKHPIMVREILSHTSGLPFGSKAEEEVGARDRLPLAAAVASYGKTPLLFQPGTTFSYANAGINTAGRIVEIVSGMPYEKFIQDRLFTPLSMIDTTFWPSAEQVQRLAKGYEKISNPPRLKEAQSGQLTYPLDKKETRYPMPAGGLFSTAADVARFCQMFLNDGTFEGKRYLSAESVTKMTTQATPAHPYGFGWRPKKDGSYWHGGAFGTYMGVAPKAGIVRVMMVQWEGNKHGIDKIHAAFATASEIIAKGLVQAP